MAEGPAATEMPAAPTLRIVHINAWDSLGGAARAAFRLHKGLQAAGQASRLLVGWKTEATPDVQALMVGGSLPKRILRRAARALDQRLGLQYVALPWSADILSHPFVQEADIIHLHNLHGGYFPLRLLPRLCEQAPVVWSLHDMWAATGHCAFSYACDRWRRGCGQCPHLDESPAIPWDTTALLWRLKQRVYRRSRLTVVAGSRWMARMAQESPLLNRFTVRVIPEGTDLSVFRPIPKAEARRLLGIPEEARVVLVFVVPVRRKGLAHFLDAVSQVEVEPAPWILGVGERLRGVPSRFPVREMGYVHSDYVLNLCYGAADLFVLPTLADNLPLSVLDALAAGLPSVAFDAGGTPELVRHLETGYLVRGADTEELARGMSAMLRDPELRSRLSHHAREVAERDFSLETSVAGHVALYEEILAAEPVRRAIR